MRPPTRRSGAAAHGPATTAATAPLDTDAITRKGIARRRPPTVHATRLLAPPDAMFDRLVVTACPWCAWPHLHHVPAGTPDGTILRSPRCHPSRTYAVRVVDIVPASTGVRAVVA